MYDTKLSKLTSEDIIKPFIDSEYEVRRGHKSDFVVVVVVWGEHLYEICEKLRGSKVEDSRVEGSRSSVLQGLWVSGVEVSSGPGVEGLWVQALKCSVAEH